MRDYNNELLNDNLKSIAVYHTESKIVDEKITTMDICGHIKDIKNVKNILNDIRHFFLEDCTTVKFIDVEISSGYINEKGFSTNANALVACYDENKGSFLHLPIDLLEYSSLCIHISVLLIK